MTPRRPSSHLSVAGLLSVAIVAAAAVWLGGALRAQPDAGSENMRERMNAMRAALRNADGGATDVGVQSTTVWGIATDFFVPSDYDGDGKNDHAVWRPGAPGSSPYKILKSTDGLELTFMIGQSGDDPTVMGDYDADGKIDPALYRPGAMAGQFSSWIYHPSSGGGDVTVTCSIGMDCGKNGDFPAPGDYNGDGKSDFMVQRTHAGAACAVNNSQGTPAPFTPNADFLLTVNVGGMHTVIPCIGRTTDIVVPGDYDGDGRTDIALFRGSGGQVEWMVRFSSSGALAPLVTFGNSATDFATQGDYDGDGKTDISVWRPSLTPGATAFFIRPSSGGPNFQVAHGQNGDYPVANWNAH